MKVLIVAAHPDDEVLGAGGSIARHISQGDQVTVVILGGGLTSRYTDPAQVAPEQLQQLQADAQQAARIMGVEDLRLFDLPDNRFDSVDLLDIVKLTEGVIEEVQPETIYTHFYADLNIDHQLTARAVLTACRPLAESPVRRLLAFEVPSSTGWGFPEQPFMPTVFVDISATLQQKLAAMAIYDSEIREFPHPRSEQSLRVRAESWGSQAGMPAAEPFMLIRERL